MNAVDASAGGQDVVFDCMKTQERLLDEIVEAGREMGVALHARNQESLERAMRTFYCLLDNFDSIEEHRQRLLRSLGGKDGAGFESALNSERLSHFRNLKSSLRAGLVKVRARMKFFNRYAQIRMESTGEFVEKFLELANSGNYDFRGQRSTPGESRPMIVSHRS